MAELKWDDSYSVGIEQFDADHKRLIETINRVARAEEAGRPVQWVLQELDDYARNHFQAEEDRMASAGYPGLEEHHKEHAAFHEWLETLKVTYSMEPEAQFHLAKTVNEFLNKWLGEHILKMDMKYKGRIS
jgi:hemerythrin-like metal-binding protein